MTAVDTSRYSEVFARCYVETDARASRPPRAAASDLVPRRRRTERRVCHRDLLRQSRFFQPFNGERIDAIRDAIERDFAGSPLYPIVLDQPDRGGRPGRFDHRGPDGLRETVGATLVQPPRAAGARAARRARDRPSGRTRAGSPRRSAASTSRTSTPPTTSTATSPTTTSGRPWSHGTPPTTTAWRASGSTRATKSTKSVFNSKRTMPAALAQVVADVDCDLLILSYNDESWLSLDELVSMCAHHEAVTSLSFDSPRYVGARIGIHNPAGTTRRHRLTPTEPRVPGAGRVAHGCGPGHRSGDALGRLSHFGSHHHRGDAVPGAEPKRDVTVGP